MRPSALETLQRRLWRLITAPEGVEAAAQSLAREDPGAAPLDRWIAAESPRASAFRVNVYAEMYFWRLLDVLRDDYPKVLGVAGEDAFQGLARAYLAAHPSENPSIRHAGRHFSKFLAGRAPAALPYLADLAGLEWARSEAFDRPDASTLQVEDLARLSPEDWPHVTFEAVPSHRLLRLSYPVHEVWMALEKKTEIPAIRPRPAAILVWREGFTVYHRAINEQDARAFELLAQGKTFGEICEVLAEGIDDIALAGEKAMTALLGWVKDGLVANSLSSSFRCL